MRSIVLVEANEIPLDLLRWYADHDPDSTIAELLRTAAVGQTIATDEPASGLYPSQTWASLATGVPYDKHQVYWYGDPKPPEFPLHWQVAARNRTVGLVGTLHSSPLSAQVPRANVRFAIPDCFADDPETIPSSLEAFQAFNIEMTNRNGRAVSPRSLGRGVLPAGAAAIRSGLRPATAARLAGLTAAVTAGQAPKERLRSAQFLLMADLFEHLLAEHRPELAIVFTNHVASNMHRYWAATFPDDWDRELYDDEWIADHRHEIPFALGLLDRTLQRLVRWVEEQSRTLILVSSMGQRANPGAETSGTFELIVEDPDRFGRALGLTDRFRVHHAMVPHVTFELDDSEAAVRAEETLRTVSLTRMPLTVDRNGDRVTVTYVLEPHRETISIGSRRVPIGDAGLRAVEVDAHRTGIHQPLGTLIVANSPTVELGPEPVDYLEFAPALLRALGIEPLEHHRSPTFTL